MVTQLIKALQRGRDHCRRTQEWRLKMSVGERSRLIDMYSQGPAGVRASPAPPQHILTHNDTAYVSRVPWKYSVVSSLHPPPLSMP